MKIFLVLAFVFVTGCVASKAPEQIKIRNLQKGRTTEDTSFVYTLPYVAGTSHLVVQGYYSSFSHKNRIALDFKMKKGTKISAARGGIVVRTKEENNLGGLNRKYRQYANYIVIEHADGTRAGYWHLQQNGVLVNVGDTVKQGQVIGLSGKTGYSAFPHLHFLVWGTHNGRWQNLPTRFMTPNGPKYLRPLRRYRHRK